MENYVNLQQRFPINLEEIECKKDKNHSSKIMLDDKIGIMMKYPDISQVGMKGSETEMGMKVISNCI